MIVITLENLLVAREKRRERQQAMSNEYGLPVVSITVNIPGPVKDSPVIRRLCLYGAEKMRQSIIVCGEQAEYSATGPSIVMAVEGGGRAVKEIANVIEEEQPFGRLLDIDVFDPAGERLARDSASSGRKCFVCSRLAALCIREGRHGQEEINSIVQSLIRQFVAYETRHISPMAEQISQIAIEAMLYEVAATPSPGLVDRRNAGAHNDMDYYTFMSSTAALTTTMARLAQAGLSHEGQPEELLPILRVIGREGEVAMLQATGGVNTQKGLLFSAGVVVAAAGLLIREKQSLTAEAIFEAVAAITSGVTETDFAKLGEESLGTLTAGERLYLRHGLAGVRGEVEAGLPSIRYVGLPAIQKALRCGLSINEALVNTLLALMTHVEDTTVVARHGTDKLDWMRQQAKAVLDYGGIDAPNGQAILLAVDDEFIAENVSPGGAADLLAVTWLIQRITSSEWNRMH